MFAEVREIVGDILKDEHFSCSVDLGCGYGEAGSVLHLHTKYLIGVDHDKGRLEVAGRRGWYKLLIHGDIRTYNPPPEADSLFLFDSLEHISKEDGVGLLKKLSWIPFQLITTPSYFFPLAMNGHMSLWSEKDLTGLGFRTIKKYTGISGLLFGKRIIALKT